MKGSGAVNRHLSLHRSPFALSSFQNARKLHCRIAVEFSFIYPPEIRFIPPDYFEGMKKSGGSAVAYAWYEWEKGYTGDTIIKWVN